MTPVLSSRVPSSAPSVARDSMQLLQTECVVLLALGIMGWRSAGCFVAGPWGLSKNKIKPTDRLHNGHSLSPGGA